MPENSTHKSTNAVNNVQPIRNSSHMAKILSVYTTLQAGDYENGNGGKRRQKGKSTYLVYPCNASIVTTVTSYNIKTACTVVLYITSVMK